MRCGYHKRRLSVPALIAGIIGCLISIPGHCADVELPLTLPMALLTEEVAGQFGAAGEILVPLYEEGLCRSLRAGHVRLTPTEGALRFTADANASLGVEVFGSCIGANNWQGSIELMLAPYVDNQRQLRLRITDSTLRNSTGGKVPVLGFAWDLTKRFVHPRLEGFHFDLSPPTAEISALVSTFAAEDIAEQIKSVLQTMTFGETRIETGRLVIPLILAVPDAWQQTEEIHAQAPLDAGSLATLTTRLEAWDAFLVYIVKQAGTDLPEDAARQRLLDVLLDSRYRLVDILANETGTTDDPVRGLFVEAWLALRDVIESSGGGRLSQDRLLRYLVFVNAADALVTLDRAAPAFGMHISVDGLRQLARSLGETGVDPVEYDLHVDPQLREMFDFAPDEPSAELPAEPPVTPVPDAAPAPRSSWLDLLIGNARAADVGVPRSLDRWLPKIAELPAYTASIQTLLTTVGENELVRTSLETQHAAIYRNLLPATAMIESCWRQYTAGGDGVTYLRSNAGSVGLMQINQHVWRGFYDIDRLKWETAYNARAGAQILMRYMKNYGLPVAVKTGNQEHLPRATYAAYNAGPRAAARFLSESQHARAKRVDDRLWRLYQGFAAGGAVDLTACTVTNTAL